MYNKIVDQKTSNRAENAKWISSDAVCESLQLERHLRDMSVGDWLFFN